MTEVQHQREIVVWDVPTAIDCGGLFRIRIGVKCQAGCDPGGWQVEVLDHEAGTAARMAVAGARWPSTAGLHVCEVELIAPAGAGLYPWTIRLRADAGDGAQGPPHGESVARFNVRAVPPGQFRTTVLAVDRCSGEPVRGLRVVAHPYRGLTNAQGTAELLLPAGNYRIFVSGQGYAPFRQDLHVQADTGLRAELEPDRAPTDAELWS